MNYLNYKNHFLAALIVLGLTNLIYGQPTNGQLQGQVFDQQNAVIVGATVSAINADNKIKSVITDSRGEFVFKGLELGKYKIRATAKGFSVYENAEFEVTANAKQQLNITLTVALEAQSVTVDNQNSVSTEPDNNGSAIVLKGADIDSLPDNPDDLQAALQALAGPGAGPDGGQIFIDGFTDGRLPPKSSIREIRINSNPFSAEFDRIGFGRIEILTKPGTSALHGQAFFNFNDESLNSRNPFAATRDSYQSRQYGGNLSGSFSKKSSFFFDFERRSIDDLAVVNASVLDSNLNLNSFSQSVKNPLRRTTFSPRIDYQLNDKNTLVGRYSFNQTASENNGIGGFSLASRGYNTKSNEHNLQLTETAIINKSIVSETRFQFLSRNSENSNGDTTSPTVQVFDAFTSGGSSVGESSNETHRWELANNTFWTIGKHSLKFGARVRGISIDDVAANNFNGSYLFTSLDQYKNTLLGTATPTQLTLTTGNPQAKINQVDVGTYLQDDWRVRPNLTLNFGLRYEAQTNVSNNKNFAPRLGFAWSPGSSNKTVIRGGFGIFYDRISENLSLNAEHYNGSNLQNYIVTDANLLKLYPSIPSVNTLVNFATPQNTYRLADDIRSPYNIQTNIGIERQLPFKFTVSANYINTRGLNQLRVRNINAPLDGVRPFGNSAGNIFQYESSGQFTQNQLLVSVRNNFSSKVSLFGVYILGNAKSDTDGANSFPVNSYDLSGEYGRSALDVRQRMILGGTVQVPFGFSFNPFVIISSGQPFNITTGLDSNGDSIFNDRPTYGQLANRCSQLNLTASYCDVSQVSDLNAIIPRNYGTGATFATVNLRLSRTFGFGGEAVNSGGMPPISGAEGSPPPFLGGGASGSSSKRYNLTFALSANNLFNTTNAGTRIGNLSSPLFGSSNSLAGGFGFGPPGATGNSTNSAAYNRRLEAQIRFSF